MKNQEEFAFKLLVTCRGRAFEIGQYCTGLILEMYETVELEDSLYWDIKACLITMARVVILPLGTLCTLDRTSAIFRVCSTRNSELIITSYSYFVSCSVMNFLELCTPGQYQQSSPIRHKIRIDI